MICSPAAVRVVSALKWLTVCLRIPRCVARANVALASIAWSGIDRLPGIALPEIARTSIGLTSFALPSVALPPIALANIALTAIAVAPAVAAVGSSPRLTVAFAALSSVAAPTSPLLVHCPGVMSRIIVERSSALASCALSTVSGGVHRHIAWAAVSTSPTIAAIIPPSGPAPAIASLAASTTPLEQGSGIQKRILIEGLDALVSAALKTSVFACAVLRRPSLLVIALDLASVIQRVAISESLDAFFGVLLQLELYESNVLVWVARRRWLPNVL